MTLGPGATEGGLRTSTGRSRLRIPTKARNGRPPVHEDGSSPAVAVRRHSEASGWTCGGIMVGTETGLAHGPLDTRPTSEYAVDAMNRPLGSCRTSTVTVRYYAFSLTRSIAGSIRVKPNQIGMLWLWESSGFDDFFPTRTRAAKRVFCACFPSFAAFLGSIPSRQRCGKAAGRSGFASWRAACVNTVFRC
jgi:hypothetical protein